MKAQEFERIRNYLTERRHRGQKWTVAAMADELLAGESTVHTWKSGTIDIPVRIAERMRKLLRECLQLEMISVCHKKFKQVDTVEGAQEFIKKLENLGDTSKEEKASWNKAIEECLGEIDEAREEGHSLKQVRYWIEKKRKK